MNGNVIVLAPHTDDAELGCGAMIAKLVGEGRRVICVAFSAAEKSLPEGLPRDTLRKEMHISMASLGVAQEDCIILNFDVRTFPEHRQAILDAMVKLAREYKPGLVFLPSINDTHQDHCVIAQEGFRAFKRSSILAYDVPWNNFRFSPTCFVEIDESLLSKKIAALEKYESQKMKGRLYIDEDFVRSQARMRGVQIGVNFAEAYEVVSWVVRL